MAAVYPAGPEPMMMSWRNAASPLVEVNGFELYCPVQHILFGGYSDRLGRNLADTVVSTPPSSGLRMTTRRTP